MKINELLVEDSVMSSWIADITLQQNQKDITMALGNGYRYAIIGSGPAHFAAWIQAPSKGKYWHQQVKSNFVVKRLI
jgi:hypothetical protein